MLHPPIMQEMEPGEQRQGSLKETLGPLIRESMEPYGNESGLLQRL